ncbi:hypothetical protein BMS3Abin02_01569 [bacterium BMS3Abin02]|nr:hypothetical protein BMS3Abin02_01569 [bacterium BMS3Abin02]HDK44734.1 hypothetical protein [Actinomycetota bacterium]
MTNPPPGRGPASLPIGVAHFVPGVPSTEQTRWHGNVLTAPASEWIVEIDLYDQSPDRLGPGAREL